MPDDVARPVPKRLRGSGAPDLLDQALEVQIALGRAPRSWAEFVSVSAHIGRASSAEKLRISDAVAAHKQKPEDWLQWQRDHEALAGL